MAPLGFNPLEWMGRQDKVQSIFKYNGTTNGNSITMMREGRIRWDRTNPVRTRSCR